MNGTSEPLCQAAARGDAQQVRDLIRWGADVNGRDAKGYTALQWAGLTGHAEIVGLLLDAGAELDAIDDQGRTALHKSAWDGHRAASQVLIDRGANAGLKDKYGRTPRDNAAHQGHADLVELIDASSQMPSQPAATVSSASGDTPLHRAASVGDEATVRRLIHSGEDVNATDIRGYTPLQWAAYNNHTSIADLLIDAGADVNGTDVDGRSALHKAAWNGHEAVSRLLLEKGANPNLSDTSGGWTPLHNATQRGHIRIAEAIVSAGARVDTRDYFGLTAADKAVERGDEAMAELLTAAGANAPARSNATHSVEPPDRRDPSPGRPSEPPSKAWIFQCNPERWDLLAALEQPVPFREDWAANQHAKEMRIGDRVYLWMSGEHAGIYGVAHIKSDLYDAPGDEFGKRKVDLVVERSLKEEPLLKDVLSQDSRTASISILTYARGTNFRLSAQEDAAIRDMLGMPAETVVGAGFGPETGTMQPDEDEDETQVLEIEQVARACCCSVQFVEDVLAQLRRKGQVIFFGPPGTGKTFVARKLAEYLAAGEESRRELIQFHPSYTYEDFMEGIKPESRQCGDDRWEVSYPVRAGSFKRFCERAADDAEHTYVFVIDEINRGQIAKIFGELMYLLEYRDDQIELAYTKSEGDDRERFGIPPNVLIIGTMNTADRSIALVDFALRRRFTFIPFYPDEGDVRGMLPTWLDGHASHMTWVGRMLDIVNKRLTEAMGRDYLIGHSYFMCDGLSEGLVREVWRYQIEPLLHEYFVGTPERVRTEFGLEALIRQAKGLPDDDADEEAASE